MQNILKESIMIIDDDLYFVTLYKKHLHNLGFNQVFHYIHPENGFSIDHTFPKIVLLSMQLKNESPIAIVDIIKNGYKDICIIMYSTVEDEYSLSFLAEESVFDFIIKEKNDLEKITLSLQRLSLVKSLTDNPCAFKKMINHDDT